MENKMIFKKTRDIGKLIRKKLRYLEYFPRKKYLKKSFKRLLKIIERK
jgi:hypothetical protein